MESLQAIDPLGRQLALARRSVEPSPGELSSTDRVSETPHRGRETYRLLTGCDPADAGIETDRSFDRHVLASILAASAMEKGWLAECAGLAAEELAALVAEWFPAATVDVDAWSPQDGRRDRDDEDEIAMVRDLLLAHRSSDGDAGRWLAAMVARR